MLSDEDVYIPNLRNWIDNALIIISCIVCLWEIYVIIQCII